MKKFVYVLALLFATGCAHRISKPVTMRMEIAYPALGNIAGTSRVWPVLRVQTEQLIGVDPGAHFLGAVGCESNSCSFAGVVHGASRPTHLATVGMDWVTSRDGDVVLVFDTFPIQLSRADYARLQYQPNKTFLVDVSFVVAGDQLHYRSLSILGTKDAPPITWK